MYALGENGAVFPTTLQGGGQVLSVEGQRALYVVRSTYSVVLRDPLEEATLDFLWPVRIEVIAGHLLVRFIVLEKNLGSYFERPYYVGDRSAEEKSVLQDVFSQIGELPAADLHAGVKALWAEGFMDSIRTQYKKPISTASETMDEERGIKDRQLGGDRTAWRY